MKAVVLGGTKGMGRAVARKLAEDGHSVFLLGRDVSELARSAKDLEIRGENTTVGYTDCDLDRTETFDQALAKANEALGGFDTVIVTAAHFATQDALEQDEARCHALLRANFVNTLMFCEKARKQLLARGGGTLCVFSSVAGERGRKPVILYGATKAGLSAYLEGLDHKFRSQGLNTVCVKPGFVKTSMTEGLKPPPFAGEPDAVASRVVKAIQRGTPVVYAPGIWQWVMLVIRFLPRAVMRRIAF